MRLGAGAAAVLAPLHRTIDDGLRVPRGSINLGKIDHRAGMLEPFFDGMHRCMRTSVAADRHLVVEYLVGTCSWMHQQGCGCRFSVDSASLPEAGPVIQIG